MAKVPDVVIVCVVVLALDMTAGLLGILAQAAQDKQQGNCNDKPNPLGAVAAVLFIVAQASANLYGLCDCICPQLKDIRASMMKRKLNFTIGWVSMAVFAVGGVLLIGGTRWWCRSHAVGIGAIMCFIHSGLIIAYYIPAIIAGCRDNPGEHP